MRRLSVSRGLGILIVLGLLAAIACGGASTATSPAPTATASAPTAVPGETPAAVPTTAPTATPPPAADAQAVVQRLRVAALWDRDTNDPALVTISRSNQYLPMYEALVEYDEFAQYVPMLATDWEVSPDAKVWTFNLRKGVQWHKGFGEFTARDIAHTFERYIRPDTLAADASTVFKPIAEKGSLDVIGDYKIVWRLDVPRVDWNETLASNWFFQILSKAHFDAEGQEGVEISAVGTGPYQFVERTTAYVLYERVPYKHWRVTPDFPELQLLNVTEPATVLAMVLAGEADIVQLPTDLLETAISRGMESITARVPTVAIYSMFGGNLREDTLGTRKGDKPDLPGSDIFHPASEVPWVDRRVREALNRAVDRDELKATILAGRGDPMYVTFWQPAMRGWNEDWENQFDDKYGYDPQRARELLEEFRADVFGDQPIDWSKTVFMITPRPSSQETEDVAEAITSYWRDVGVEIKIETREQAFVIEKHILPGAMGGIAWTDATRQFSDPLMLGIIYWSGNFCCHFFESKEVDDIYDKLVAETDLNERDRLLREAGNFLFSEYATVPLFWLSAEFVVNPKVVADYPTSGQFPPRDLEKVKAVMK